MAKNRTFGSVMVLIYFMFLYPQPYELHNLIRMSLKPFILVICLTLMHSLSGLAQGEGSPLVYTKQFTETLHSSGLEIRQDSLENYILTNRTNPYLKNIDLYLFHPQTGKEVIVLIDENSIFPQMKFSGHITNLMNNDNDHAVAFYSLDSYFILTELGAAWAMDSQFIPKDKQEILGYSRSFYNPDSGIQVTIILLASELPILSTPRELTALRFRQ